MEYAVKDTLRNKRLLEAESQLLHEQFENGRIKSNTAVGERMRIVDTKLKRISIWLLLLTDDERYVIQRHYLDGVDIPRIVLEYKERWGDEFTKTERTIKSYQRRAITKICTFELQNQACVFVEHLQHFDCMHIGTALHFMKQCTYIVLNFLVFSITT